MVYNILMFAYRKPGTTPEHFRTYYDTVQVPLIRELAGAAFPHVAHAAIHTPI